MAAEELDIGILMGSRSMSIFLDHVDRYPGARHLYDVIQQTPCECGDESCSRRTFQFVIHEAAGNDRGLAAEFIVKAEKANNPIELKEIIYEAFHARVLQEETSSVTAEQPRTYSIFGSGNITGSGIPILADSIMGHIAPDGDLDNDEPEHSGPREE